VSGDLRFYATTFRGGVSNDPLIGGDDLVTELDGMGTFDEATQNEKPTSVVFERCRFEGGRIALKADDFVVQNTFCAALLAKARIAQKNPNLTVAQFKAAHPGACELFSYPVQNKANTFPLFQSCRTSAER
jgi:hypothetical protein